MYEYGYDSYQNRIILCIDLKSFYASCSCLSMGLDPLTTKLAVVGDVTRSGSIVLAATPPLKALGIKQGSRLFDIPQEQDIHVVNPSMAQYIHVSKQITSIALQYTAPEDFHQYSIDEMFLDATQSIHLFAKAPYELAQHLISTIREQTGIPAAAGIGPNLLLAKIALDREAKKTKQSIAHWTYDDVQTKLWSIQPLSQFWGISANTEKKLNRLGIFSVKQLAKSSLELLKKHFGIIGEELHRHANGVDESRIANLYIPSSNSIGKSQILLRDYMQLSEIQVVLLEHIEEVCFRLRSQRKLARTIQFSISYSREWGAGGFSRMHTLEEPTNLTMECYKTCLQILQESYTGEPIRKLSVSLTNLIDDDEVQLSLFKHGLRREKERNLAFTVDEVRNKHGKNSLLRAVSYTAGSTVQYRNTLIGGHKA
ncbi:Y-family DNA polymerase [Bacillus sp. 165]|uniref:Y-family DNA polymerase n=1 Tax=Bacillus sp. 165 TaxID=1529117 RepID=UPI001ADC1637|nr:Y-family DNA polymerase [Bacillus sp. 165]MBO9129369.1 Y-family DNA polymerase [Bacillus sp. 165]